MAKLGFLGTQEFSTCRGVIKKITDFQCRATWVRRRLHGYRHLATLAECLLALRRGRLCIGGQCQPRHRRNGRQGLTAKSQRVHRFEVFNAVDLAGRMTRQSQRQIVAINASAVIANSDQPRAAGLHVNLDPGGSSIQAVFDRLFDNRGRALNHLARGNLIRQTGLQNSNHAHPSGITKV